jgi:hypothetical protein
MTLKEFFYLLEARHQHQIDWEYSGMTYLRSDIYNTHTLGLDKELKQARLDLLFKLDEFYGTDINDRQY